MNSFTSIRTMDRAAAAFADAMTSSRPRVNARAALATFAFASVGAWCALTVTDWAVSGPLVSCFGVLLLNTYLSARRFAQVAATLEEPASIRRARHAVDVSIALTFALLASTFDSPRRFAAVATLLFTLATLKYALLLGRAVETQLLALEIRVDVLGTIACASAPWVMNAGYTPEACWGLAAVSALLTVHLVWLRPLYR